MKGISTFADASPSVKLKRPALFVLVCVGIPYLLACSGDDQRSDGSLSITASYVGGSSVDDCDAVAVDQRGKAKWDDQALTAIVNRTEALDASRAAIRDRKVVLPRRCPRVEEFATQMANDAKQLREDPATGAQAYRYLRTGPDHFSLAFTYDCIAWAEEVKVGKLLYI